MASGLWGSLSACWDSVSAQLPVLGAQLGALQVDFQRRLHAAGIHVGGGGEVLQLGRRRFRVLRKLGEGGYAYVYEVQEEVATTALGTAAASRVEPLALKKVLVGMREQLEEAQHEINIMQQLHHPNLMPLLDSAVVDLPVHGSAGAHTAVLLLTPLCSGGNVFDVVQTAMPTGGLPLSEVLSIFVQVCAGLEAMHTKALAHRDVKPHNVLLHPIAGSSMATASIATAPASSDAAHLTGSLGMPARSQGRYYAVLIDFGSTRPAHVVVHNRAEAVALQEDAERHCSAPYRAPELWDVRSSCTIDERIDVWSLGCLLFYMLCGESPFERSANAGGGSLMLSVLNGRVSWPDESASVSHSTGGHSIVQAQSRSPSAVRELVAACLTMDPSLRPFVGEVRRRAMQLLSEYG